MTNITRKYRLLGSMASPDGLVKEAVNVGHLLRFARILKGRGGLVQEGVGLGRTQNYRNLKGLGAGELGAAVKPKKHFTRKLHKADQRYDLSPFGREIAKMPTRGVMKALGPLMGKIVMPRGGSVGAFQRVDKRIRKGVKGALRRETPGNRRLRLLRRKVRAFRGKEPSGHPLVNPDFAGKPAAQKLTNLWTIRHEGAEQAAMRRRPNAVGFSGHHDPTPMLNDMNIAATLKGPGADSTAQFIRKMRAPELESLGKVIYPKATMLPVDPRRFFRRKQYRSQKAALDHLQALGQPGNRASRHYIKSIAKLYDDAAKRNTFAAVRARGGLHGLSNRGIFKRRHPRLNHLAPRVAGGLGLGGVALHASGKKKGWW